MGSKPAKIPPAPDPINPVGPITIEALLGNQNVSGPYGRQEKGRYDADGNWHAADVSSILARALADPQKPDFGALGELLSLETRFQEDPQLEAMRRGSWDLVGRNQGMSNAYMDQFAKPGARSDLPGLLPLVTPSHKQYVWQTFDPKKG